MTIIDGIGDEVTFFFIAVIVVVIAIVAWITTDIQQNLYVRTVYLLENSRHQRDQARLTRLTNHVESDTISEGVVSDGTVVEATAAEQVENSQSEDPAIEEIIETMDAGTENSGEDDSVLRQRRLQRFGNVATAANTSAEEILPESTRPDQTNMDQPSSDQDCTDETSPITIKLKFIDDNLRIVDARLQELLGDFKRRHFDVELASNKLVRLIFQGQVLKHDQQTLESYGMFDKCVVHCLVHQVRTPAQGESPLHVETIGPTSGTNSTHTHRDWDLGNLLIATLSFTLGSAWYFRFQYPQLFTIWTTIGLIGLTSGFGVIALVRYFPDFLTRDPVVVVH